MRALPENLVAYKRTPEFDQDSVPAGLLRSHRTKAGVWGRIHVLEGALHYRILEPFLEPHRLEPGTDGVVEPEIPHEVEPEGSVRFYVEFLRVERAARCSEGADVKLTPLIDAPILSVETEPRLEGNVNGPSLVRAPAWVESPLGAYYLYFAHHEGTSIRLATADTLEGPFTLYEPGALALRDSRFPVEAISKEDLSPVIRPIIEAGFDDLYAHIASPDVIVDEIRQEVRLYYHGRHTNGMQLTRVALSSDGLHFTARDELLGRSYFRVFRHAEFWYALSMPGELSRSRDGLSSFEQGPMLFDPNMRHSALLLRGDRLHVFYTRAGDAPERILLSTIELTSDWKDWRESEAIEIHRAERPWEGTWLPVAPSIRGALMKPANQLRDPAIFEEDGEVYLLYSVAGEQGLAIGRLSGV